jgi:hypothetical protein
VDQGQDEQGSPVALASNADKGGAEVDLGVAGRVVQGDEDFGLGLTQLGHGGADDALAAAIPQTAEAVVDAPGGVTLLGRSGPVVLEDLLDDGEEWPKPGLGSGAGALLTGGRLELVDDLFDGTEIEVVLGGGLADAQFAGQDTTPDFSPELHVGEHSRPSRSRGEMPQA